MSPRSSRSRCRRRAGGGEYSSGAAEARARRIPGRVNWAGATLRDLIMDAYGVKRYQVTGPDWIDPERYDVVAKVPAGATKEQVRVMWQNLLADRFGLVFHRRAEGVSGGGTDGGQGRAQS